MSSTWLVTGGAGYIGSHIVRALLEAGMTPVVIDDLSSGHAHFVPESVTFVQESILNTEVVRQTLADSVCDGVIHVAGFKYAGVSVSQPLHTYTQNVTGTLSVLQAMQEVGVTRYVFSSSASVYGTPDVDLVVESTPTHPESPYGQTKLIGEWLNADMAVVIPEWTGTCLRYFNVVGSGTPDLCDTSPHNLFPLVFDALANGKIPRINGTDYPTPDGTCVRDYIHVADLALAHVAAAQAMMDKRPLLPAYNLGSGDGVSVRQIMDTVREVTGIDFEPTIEPRRPGDPSRIVASGDLAASDLGWKMRHTLQQMVASAWEARNNLN